jgi:hypothetical protein
MSSKRVLVLLVILALFAGAWWSWRSYQKPPVVPAERRVQEAVTSAASAVAEAQDAVKKGKAILRQIPGEVRKIEQKAMDAALSADLATLADRANARLGEWLRQHPATGNTIQSSDAGPGAVLSGTGGPGE